MHRCSVLIANRGNFLASLLFRYVSMASDASADAGNMSMTRSFACLNVDYRDPTKPTMALRLSESSGDIEEFDNAIKFVERLKQLREQNTELITFNGISYVFSPLLRDILGGKSQELVDDVKELAIGHTDILVAFFAEHGKFTQRRRIALQRSVGGYWWPCDAPPKYEHVHVLDELWSLCKTLLAEFRLSYRLKTGGPSDKRKWVPMVPDSASPWFMNVRQCVDAWASLEESERPNHWMSPAFKKEMVGDVVPTEFLIGPEPQRAPPTPP